jgi:hypothetical protein
MNVNEITLTELQNALATGIINGIEYAEMSRFWYAGL